MIDDNIAWKARIMTVLGIDTIYPYCCKLDALLYNKENCDRTTTACTLSKFCCPSVIEFMR